jgi:hypothetical protein
MLIPCDEMKHASAARENSGIIDFREIFQLADSIDGLLP